MRHIGALRGDWGGALFYNLLCWGDILLLCLASTTCRSFWNALSSSSRLETRIKESYCMERVLVTNQRLVLKENSKEGGRDPFGTWSGGMIFLKPVSRIHIVRTRKMMSYTRVGWSLLKRRWRSITVLTCKLLVELWYRGEILIESFSCWFHSKFPPG